MEFSFMPVAMVIGGVILTAIVLVLVVELISSGFFNRVSDRHGRKRP